MQNKYEVLEIVGEGAFGIVMKCKNKETGDIVAIKKFKDTEDEVVQKSMLRELKVLKKLRHDNIVQLKESFRRKGKLYLVFEYLEKNLLQLIEENPSGVEQGLIKKIIYQLCKAVIYIHSNDTLHRDIKPENILVTNENLVKVCDFGFARGLPQKGGILTDYVATRWYRAPELLLGCTNYGKEVDFWAVGCIMGELTDGQPMFPGDNELSQLTLIQKLLGNLPQSQLELFYSNPMYSGNKLEQVLKPETLERRYFGKFSKPALAFMKALLKLDPKERLSGNDLIMHPYFEECRYDDPEFAHLKNNFNSTKSNFQQIKNPTTNNMNNRGNKFQNTKTNFYQTNNLSKSPPKESVPINNANNNLKQQQPQIRIPKKFHINYEGNNAQNTNTINNSNLNTNLGNASQLNLNNINTGLLKTAYKSFYNISENKDDVYNFDIDTNFEETAKPEATINPYNKKKKNNVGVNIGNLKIIEEDNDYDKVENKPNKGMNIIKQNTKVEKINKFKPDTGSEFYDEEVISNQKIYNSPKNVIPSQPKNYNIGHFNFLPQISSHRGYDLKKK